jgi:RHS repeat-associated protein
MYNEQMDYDKNGNIQSLKRNGDFDSNIYGFMEIDDLVYDYDDNLKNQLVNVTDNTNDPKGFKDENNGTADYAYDANGNMIKDENKYISSIVYNHLNLPTQINFATGDKIEYLYDAIGQKKSKKVTQADTETLTDYLDGFQYTNEVLNFFPHAEGYVNMSYCRRCDEQGSKFEFNYVYNYTDHLGNIRVSYSVDKIDRVLKILEENHYYPFGLKHTNYNSGNKKYYEEDIVQPIGMAVAEAPAELEAFGKKIIQTLPSDGVMYKYKYNGKEWQDELGLNVYALDWRQYDPALGRFSTLDPETDEPEQLDKSPYAFAWNNPVLNNDPDGRNPIKGWLKKALKALADDGVKYAAKTSKGGIKPVSQKSAEKMLKQGRSIIKTPDGSSNKVAKRTMESASGGKKVVRHDGHDLVNAQGENTGDKGLNHFQKKGRRWKSCILHK